LLAKILFDLQVPTDACYGKFNVTSGTRNDLVVTLPTPAASPVVAALADVDDAIAAALLPLGTAGTGGQLVSAIQIDSGELIAESAAAGANIFSYTLFEVNIYYWLITFKSIFPFICLHIFTTES